MDGEEQERVHDPRLMSIVLTETTRVWIEVYAGVEVGFLSFVFDDESESDYWKVLVRKSGKRWETKYDTFTEACTGYELATTDPKLFREDCDQWYHEATDVL